MGSSWLEGMSGATLKTSGATVPAHCYCRLGQRGRPLAQTDLTEVEPTCVLPAPGARQLAERRWLNCWHGGEVRGWRAGRSYGWTPSLDQARCAAH